MADRTREDVEEQRDRVRTVLASIRTRRSRAQDRLAQLHATEAELDALLKDYTLGQMVEATRMVEEANRRRPAGRLPVCPSTQTATGRQTRRGGVVVRRMGRLGQGPSAPLPDGREPAWLSHRLFVYSLAPFGGVSVSRRPEGEPARPRRPRTVTGRMLRPSALAARGRHPRRSGAAPRGRRRRPGAEVPLPALQRRMDGGALMDMDEARKIVADTVVVGTYLVLHDDDGNHLNGKDVPSLKDYTLGQMVEATRMVEEANRRPEGHTGAWHTQTVCDDRLLAALYVAHHYPASDPESIEPICLLPGGQLVCVVDSRGVG